MPFLCEGGRTRFGRLFRRQPGELVHLCEALAFGRKKVAEISRGAADGIDTQLGKAGADIGQLEHGG
jgi:hypothetical protein